MYPPAVHPRPPQAGGRDAALRGLAALLLAGLICGCASPAMKGTPFYSGEYEVRRGPVEDRVNLWPLFYYREPALSVLWPLGEKTDDHLALRPLFSVYALDTDQPVVNVLWPLAQFDTESGNHRIFPVFWGREHAAVFPLYWHRGHPLAGEGYDTLFPLWYYRTDSHGYDTYAPWPLVHAKNRYGETGWHVWPLAGRYADAGGEYSFAAWPLAHWWSRRQGAEGGSALFPLYYHDRAPERSTLLTPLYSQGEGPGDRGWRLLFPLFYSRREKDDRLVATLLGGWRRSDDGASWLALPLLAAGSSAPDARSTWIGGPLAHFRRDEDSRAQHVFPLWYHSRDPDGSLFLSLPWSSARNADGSAWQLALPFCFHGKSRQSDALITPLYARGESGGGDMRWSTLLPLYYRRQEGDARLVATLLGGYRTDPSGHAWLVYPLLSWERRDQGGRDLWFLAPLGHVRTDAESVSHHLLPLYYWDGRKRTFLSPLAARWSTATGGRTTLFPPLLSWRTSGPGATNLWLAGGLAHFGWGRKAESSYVAPLFYRNRHGTLISPLLASWKTGGEGRQWVCPPLLSWYSREGDERELNGLLGVWREAWNGSGHEGHLLPLYLYRGKEEFYTPLAGWRRGRDRGFLYPLTPLFGLWTGDSSGGWLFPLGSFRRPHGSRDYSGTFLWGGYRREGATARSGLWPLYGYENRGPAPADGPRTRPEVYGRRFWSLPACWYRNQVRVGSDPGGPGDGAPSRIVATRVEQHGCFPLWSRSRETVPESDTLRIDRSVLLLLHDYKRTVAPSAAVPGTKDDYTRSRVLWRVFHYERSNGDVSVDILPAITYDRKADGFKRVSFLWRFFRYERGPDGRKVDLLYVPVFRGKPSGP